MALLVPSTLIAAPHSTPSTPRMHSATSRGVNRTELREFAAAYGKVTLIRKKLLIETHGMSDDSRVAALKAQARKKMKQAIRRHMTLGEYVRVGHAVNSNPRLHKRFMRIRNAESPAAPASTAG